MTFKELVENSGAIPAFNDLYMAFKSEMVATWSGLKADINDMSYNRMLSCFLRGGRLGEAQRRELMRYYLRGSGFSTAESLDSLNKMRSVISSSNLELKRVLNNSCNIYKNKPVRKSKQLKEELIYEIETETNINSIMNQVHKKARLCGEVLIKVSVRNKELRLQVLMPDMYLAVKDEFGNLVEVYIPYKEKIVNPLTKDVTEVQRYEYWNDSVYQILDSEGKAVEFTVNSRYNTDRPTVKQEIVTSWTHPYKQIPMILFSFGSDYEGYDYPEDLIELVKLQLELNMIDFCQKENLFYNGFSIFYFINFGMGKRGGKIAPNSYLYVDDVNPDTVPEANTLSPSAQYLDMQELKNDKTALMYKSAGLPASLISDSGDTPSGEALFQQWREIEELREAEQADLRALERRLWSLIQVVGNNDLASKYRGKLPEFKITIDYTEGQKYETFEDKLLRLAARKKSGTITLLEYYQSLSQDDSVQTDDEAKEIINYNLNKFKEVEDGDDSGDTQSITSEATTGAVIGGTSENEEGFDENAGGIN